MSEDSYAEPVVLALDIGTSSARAALYDAEGRLLPDTLSALPHAARTTPDGGSELVAEEILERCVSLMAQCLAAAPNVRVAAVGTTCFLHSVLGVGVDGSPLTPVYLWSDTRARSALPRLEQELDARALYERTRCPLHPSYLPAKLLWLRETQPGVHRAVRRWLSMGEYLHLRLLGRTACADAMASGTGLYDQAERAWDELALDAAGVVPDELAPLVDAAEPVGTLRPEFASRLPGLKGAAWYPAIGDGISSNFGSGGAAPGIATLNYGTSAAIRLVARELPPFTPGLWVYRVDGGRLLFGGSFSNAGNLYAWLLKTLRLSPEEAEERLRDGTPGSGGLSFLPHLAGERSPGWTADATGALFGLRLNSSPADIYAAGMEGMLAEFSQVHYMLNTASGGVREVVAGGGAVRKSEALRQALADALGRPVRVCLETEPTARGVALLALEALGAVKDAAQVAAAKSEPYLPDEERHAIYKKIGRRRALYGGTAEGD